MPIIGGSFGRPISGQFIPSYAELMDIIFLSVLIAISFPP
jgi:hypothetical protein